jgi:hypothetical protein
MAKRKSQSRAAKLERCVMQVKKQGHSKASAFAICNASLGKKRRKG